MKDPTEKEKFELIRQRFIESVKMIPEDIEAAIDLNKALHIYTPEEMFRYFTI